MLCRNASVRDPAEGSNIAMLTFRAFLTDAPSERQTWCIRMTRGKFIAIFRRWKGLLFA